MTILELLQKTTAYLEKAGVPNPRLDTELLLGYVLHLKRMEIYLQFERKLTEQELNALRPMVKRRAAREPLQHIMGTVDFCGLELVVSRQALIPRPETEILVQTAIDIIGRESYTAVLDLGTGSGAIALAVTKTCPTVACIATDISEEALALARVNAEKHGLSHRVEFRCGNLFDRLANGEVFNLILSNPPYIPSGEIPKLQPEVQHDPPQSLDGGVDGLDFIRRLISEAGRFLNGGGRLVFEIGHDQAKQVQALLEAQGWSGIVFIRDLHGFSRVVHALRKNDS